MGWHIRQTVREQINIVFILKVLLEFRSPKLRIETAQSACFPVVFSTLLRDIISGSTPHLWFKHSICKEQREDLDKKYGAYKYIIVINVFIWDSKLGSLCVSRAPAGFLLRKIIKSHVLRLMASCYS